MALPAVAGTATALSEESLSLGGEVAKFRNVDDEVALGDLEIRKVFARNVMLLFAATNVFVMIGLGWVATDESSKIAGHTLLAADRIVNANVVMALLGATTVQLGTVIYTIARAIFPPSPTDGR